MKKRIANKNIFKDMGFSNAEAQHLLLRAELMQEILNIIERKGWTQAQAAKHMGISQPRISEIKADKIELFTIDNLVTMLATLNKRVEIRIKNAA